MTTSLTNLRTLINEICTRPGMFVLGGKFESVAAFVDGYDCAIQEFTGVGRDETDLGRFRSWLAQRFYEMKDLPRNLPWSSYLVEAYKEDSARFQQLPLLFDQFLEESA